MQAINLDKRYIDDLRWHSSRQRGECHMKKDTEVKLLMQERRKGTSQRLAAARAGMGERTARKYEQASELPSQLKRPHTWATRTNPFEQDWPWVVAQLERDPALQGSTLFALLCEQHPGRYRPTPIRFHAYGGSGRDHCRRTLSSHGLSLCADLLQRRSCQHFLQRNLRGTG